MPIKEHAKSKPCKKPKVRAGNVGARDQGHCVNPCNKLVFPEKSKRCQDAKKDRDDLIEKTKKLKDAISKTRADIKKPAKQPTKREAPPRPKAGQTKPKAAKELHNELEPESKRKLVMSKLSEATKNAQAQSDILKDTRKKVNALR